jgi:EmrB/QacA subfamily drug resistance transporter
MNPLATFWVVIGGAFLAGLGSSSVPILLPLVRADLGIALGDVAWVVTSHALALTSLLLAGGRLGDLHGHRATYRVGFIIVALGSAASSIAPTFALLLAARVVQGAGSALLTANGPALLTSQYPAAKRGRVLGMQATAVYAGLTSGPAIAGVVSRALGWRGVLAMIAPLALVGVVAARALPRAGDVRSRAFDARGATLFAAALVAALVALGRGGTWGWANARTLVALAVAIVCASAFVRVERSASAPIVPPDLVRAAPFSLGLVAAVLQYVAVATVTLLVPFALRAAAHLDALASGWLLSVQPAVMMLTAVWSGALADRIGTRPPATAGMVMLALGLWRLGAIDEGASAASFIAPLATIGLGAGLFAPPNNSSVLGAAPRERQGVAGGLMGTARNVGMSIGVAASGALLAAASSDAGASVLQACRRALGLACVLSLAGALLSLVRPSAPKPPAAC